VIDRIGGRKAYLDSNIFIYGFEHYPAFSAECKAVFRALASGELELVTNETVLVEILPKALRGKNAGLAEFYVELLTSTPNLQLVGVSSEIIMKAAALRGAAKLGTPDAIHLATALATGCAVFVTADKGIPPPNGMDMVYLEARPI
jgi:predicted nucleic acid-binding protein